MTTPDQSYSLCCQLWAVPGLEQELHDYEDTVLPFFDDHGIVLNERVIGSGLDGNPVEVHVYTIPSKDALDAYVEDPRRTELSDVRDRVIARTAIFPVNRV